MEFISVRDLRVYTGQVWEKLEKEHDLIITSNGRPVALMTGIEGSSLETILAAVRRNEIGALVPARTGLAWERARTDTVRSPSHALSTAHSHWRLATQAAVPPSESLRT